MQSSMLIRFKASFVSNKHERGEFPSIGVKNMGVADNSTTPRGWPAKHGGLGGMGMAGRHYNAIPRNLVPGGRTIFSDLLKLRAGRITRSRLAPLWLPQDSPPTVVCLSVATSRC